jgi:hypothetical protein
LIYKFLMLLTEDKFRQRSYKKYQTSLHLIGRHGEHLLCFITASARRPAGSSPAAAAPAPESAARRAAASAAEHSAATTAAAAAARELGSLLVNHLHNALLGKLNL